MKGLILFLLGVQSAQAGTVLLPAFMPETPEDKAHADRFHDALLIELVASGHTAIGQDALRGRVGAIVDTCAVTVDCPAQLFAAYPAPVAIVGEVYADGEDMGVVTSVYSPDSEAPIKVLDQTVRAGEDWVGVETLLEIVASLVPDPREEVGILSLLDEDFAPVEAVQAEGRAEEAEEASAVERMGNSDERLDLSDAAVLRLLGVGETGQGNMSEDLYSSGPDPLAARGGDNDDSAVEEDTTIDEPLEEQLFDPRPLEVEDVLAEDSVALLDIPIADGPDSRLEPEPRDDMLDMPEEEFPTRGELNLDPILYGLLEKSELEVGQWFRKWRPHVNNGHIEIFGGVPYGDTVRSYDVRVALDATSLQQVGTSERDVFKEGIGYEFGAAVGFTPSPWFDLSALFSVMGGTKELTTGWATIDGTFVEDSDIHVHSSTQSWQAVIEPRMRVYLLPVSWMKVYGLGGITVRFADSYQVPDLQVVDYPDRPSWTMVGWMVGGGLMFDPHDKIGIFVEAPWVHWFQPGDLYNSQSGVLPPILAQPVQKTGWVLRGSAGVQFRL